MQRLATTRRWVAAALAALAVAAATGACRMRSEGGAHGDVQGLGPGGAAAAGAGGAGGVAASTSTGGGMGGQGNAPGGVPTPCAGHVYECGDLLDNDGDGQPDAADPDCLGPCDNTEDSFYNGIPGTECVACILDCYFDQDSGAGNDECHWNHKCDPHEIAPSYFPQPWSGASCAYDPMANTPGTDATCDELYAAQTQICHDSCGPLTPNGCDCFGCCELPAGSESWVWIGADGEDGGGTCTAADVGDPWKCPPCMPVASCVNECEPCEVCIGRPEPDPGCIQGAGGGGAAGQQCPEGVQPCGLPGQSSCPPGFYCITGCCHPSPQ